MAPMRIALLSWESLYSIPVGGLGAHVSELAAALHRRGNDVHVFTRMGPNQFHYDRIDGVHYHRCAINDHPNIVTYISWMCESFISRLVEVEAFDKRPFDIIHGHDWLAAKALVEAKMKLGRRTVLTMHSSEYGRCGNELGRGVSSRIRGVEWEGIYMADRVVCVSRALKDEVGWLYGVPEEKMTVIYNGVDVQRFDVEVDPLSVRRQNGVDEHDPMILFAGRLAWQKGPDLLVETIPGLLRYHPRTKFVFAGDGNMRDSLQDQVSRLGIGGSARFLGHQSGHSLVSLFRTADAVCVPSRNEPFGIVILEAWSATKPVIATRNGGPAEFIRHQETGLTVSATEESIGWGLGTALADLHGAQQMGRNGRQEAESRFSWDVIAGQTEGVYQLV